MTTATYFVLAALLEERLHGYGIVRKVNDLSGGDVGLTAGTLYGVLDRLARQGLVVHDGEEVVDGRFRRYYRITTEGADLVGEEAARLRRAARAVPSRIPRRSRTA